MQELIPFKGEMKQPPGSDTKVSACKYDEHIYIGRNVILVQRDIRVPPSESYYVSKSTSIFNANSIELRRTLSDESI